MGNAIGSLVFKTTKEQLSHIPKSFWELQAKNIDGKLVDFHQLQGKKAYIVVNVASACGFTDVNYKGLSELYQKYRDQGLEILAFPCNQFMNQESKCELDIKNFAKGKYSVDFPLFSKVEVNGPETHDVFKYIRANSPLYNQSTNQVQYIPWNFTKFLLDKDGKILKMYGPNDKPQTMEEDIQKLLSH